MQFVDGTFQTDTPDTIHPGRGKNCLDSLIQSKHVAFTEYPTSRHLYKKPFDTCTVSTGRCLTFKKKTARSPPGEQHRGLSVSGLFTRGKLAYTKSSGLASQCIFR